MNIKKRLIISSLVSVTALLAVSLSFSLAWYSNGDRLSISTVDIAVKTDPRIRVSTSNDLSTFVDNLDLNSDEFEEDGKKFLFEPVSSMYRDEWLDANADTPIFYNCASTASVNSDTKEEIHQGFYQKKLYLLTDLDYYVGLDIKQSLFENDEAANSLRAQEVYTSKDNEVLQYTKEEINESLNKLKNCLRVSLLINDVEDESRINNRYNIINPTKESEDDKVYFGGLLDNDNDGYYDTVPVNGLDAEAEFLYGEVNDRSLIQFQDPEITDPDYEDEKLEPSMRFIGNSFRGEHKKSVYTYDENASKNNNLTFKEEGALTLDEVEDWDKGILIPCYANQPREIVLSIYLEGWDLDCINGTMGASFNTKLSFKILRGLI